MAVLKDLIVHGSSRFLNKIYASQIQAESGIFNKLIAKDLQAGKATVVGLLDVQGQLHTNAWTNSNIATIDGSFYITPTISSAEGTASNISATTIQFVPRNNTFAVVSSLYYYDTSAHEGTWLKYSKVLVTGQVQLNGEWIPLGTILGYLNADGTATSLVIAGAEDNKHRASPVLAQLVANGVTTSTSLNYRNLKVSLYQRSSSSSNNADAYKYPLGIFMTAMGTNGKTFLDIYGGGNVLTTTYGGYADPNVRIGNLSGLPAVGNQTPVGWGIYTTNGYFKGTVAADNGYIGGASISNGVLTVPAANVSGELTAATINGSKITANSITAGQIATNAITTDELAANAVTSAKIKAGEVKATNIASNAVTADKLDATTINASKKLTVGAMTTTDQNNILNSNIQIGGRNLLKNSNIVNTSLSNFVAGGAITQTISSGTTITLSVQVDADDIVWKSSGNRRIGVASSITKDGGGTQYIEAWAAISGYTSAGVDKTFDTSFHGRVKSTYMLQGELPLDKVFNLHIQGITSGTVSVSRPKLEIGNKATDWSPAPEDTDVHKYVTDIDSNKGITIKPADTSGNDYLQINSSAINFYRNNVETLKIEDSAIRVGKLGNNLRNIYITDSAVQIRNNTSVLAEYGSSIKLYQPTTTTVAVEISSTGATFTGNVKATSLSTGTKTAAETGNGFYVDSSGNIYVGNESTNNFTVTNAGVLTAKYGNIAGWSFDTNSFKMGTWGTDNSAIICTGTETAKPVGGSESINGWVFAAGAKFGVTKMGDLYASNAHIVGEITANSGSIASSVTIGTGGVSLSTIQSNASNGKEAYDLQYSSDTRNKNENPQYYITNYPRKQVNEFKSASTIGLTTGNGYCTLTTIVPWGDSSGGYPKQEANFNGKRYWRQGTSATAWSAWVDASAVATSYIVADSTGLMIADMSGGTATSSNVSSQNVFIDSNSVNIRNGQNVLAKFGTTTQIGENGKTRVEVDYHSLKLIDLRNETYFHLSDLRDAYGRLAVEDSFIADGHTRVFDLSYNASNTDYTVTVSDSSGGDAHTAILNFIFDTAPTEGAIITATYYTTSYDAKAITFGTRLSGTVGGMSMAIGTANIASNGRSIAIGMRNSATGQGSVAIGRDCKATGEEAFAIGYETEATHHAVAQNQGTKASSLWQTAMGSYNIEDKAGKYALIIGNGDADIRRSNAYAVTFDGDEHLALDTAATTGTIDGNLYAAISTLGWGSEVTV